MNILRQKYSHKLLSKKLDELPVNYQTYSRLHNIVETTKNILYDSIHHTNSNEIEKLRFEFIFIDEIPMSSKEYDKEYDSHKTLFTIRPLQKIIMLIIRNYTKMYKQIKNKNIHYNNEKKIFALIMYILQK